MTSDNDSAFAAFLADLLGRIDRGEPIDRERLLADHADLRPQLESFFRGQSLVGELLGRQAEGGRESFSHLQRESTDLVFREKDSRPLIAGLELLEEIGRRT